MTRINVIVLETCKACLEPRELDEHGLCQKCNDLNEAVHGALLALLDEIKTA